MVGKKTEEVFSMMNILEKKICLIIIMVDMNQEIFLYH